MSVKVGVRVRPFNQRQLFLSSRCSIQMPTNNRIRLKISDRQKNLTNAKAQFTFDYTFWSHDQFVSLQNGLLVGTSEKYWDQKRIFTAIGKQMISDAWSGYNCCLFAYGQTGAGKSYSMLGYGQNKGIVPLTFQQMFRRVQSQSSPSKIFTITMTMIQIYNQKIQDLLVSPQKRPLGGLQIRQNKTLGVYVEGVTKCTIHSLKQMQRWMEQGTKNRSVASNLMNQYSSRAHTIITLQFVQRQQVAKKQVTQKSSLIHLIDLAGSERVKKTGLVGADRLKQASSINTSLHVLGKVIQLLAEKSQGKKKNQIVPYRQSCLTKFLQNSLGGNSRTRVICAISPASDNLQQTLSTLRYADQLKKIKNIAIVNQNSADKIIRQLKEQNDKLKDMIRQYNEKSMISPQEQDLLADIRKTQQMVVKQINSNRKAMQSFAPVLQQYQDDTNNILNNISFIDFQNGNTINQQNQNQYSGFVDFSMFKSDQPYITNLNQDPILSGKVRYNINFGEELLIGRRNGEPRPQVILGSPGVRANHAKLYLRQEKLYLKVIDEGASQFTFLNGQNVPQSQILVYNLDRIIFGSSSVFLVINPANPTARNLLWQQKNLNYQFAMQELENGNINRHLTQSSQMQISLKMLEDQLQRQKKRMQQQINYQKCRFEQQLRRIKYQKQKQNDQLIRQLKKREQQQRILIQQKQKILRQREFQNNYPLKRMMTQQQHYQESSQYSPDDSYNNLQHLSYNSEAEHSLTKYITQHIANLNINKDNQDEDLLLEQDINSSNSILKNIDQKKLQKTGPILTKIPSIDQQVKNYKLINDMKNNEVKNEKKNDHDIKTLTQQFIQQSTQDDKNQKNIQNSQKTPTFKAINLKQYGTMTDVQIMMNSINKEMQLKQKNVSEMGINTDEIERDEKVEIQIKDEIQKKYIKKIEELMKKIEQLQQKNGLTSDIEVQTDDNMTTKRQIFAQQYKMQNKQVSLFQNITISSNQKLINNQNILSNYNKQQTQKIQLISPSKQQNLSKKITTSSETTTTDQITKLQITPYPVHTSNSQKQKVQQKNLNKIQQLQNINQTRNQSSNQIQSIIKEQIKLNQQIQSNKGGSAIKHKHRSNDKHNHLHRRHTLNRLIIPNRNINHDFQQARLKQIQQFQQRIIESKNRALQQLKRNQQALVEKQKALMNQSLLNQRILDLHRRQKQSQTASIAYLKKQKLITQKRLLQLLPQVTQFNLIGRQMGRNVEFTLRILYDYLDHYGFKKLNIFNNQDSIGKVKMKVMVQNFEEGRVYFWTIQRFKNRLTLAKDYLQKYLSLVSHKKKGQVIPIQQIHNKQQDPFWDPPDYRLLGQSYLSLQHLLYGLDYSNKSLGIIGEGIIRGAISLRIYNCDQKGIEIKDLFLLGQQGLLGKDLIYAVQIQNIKIRKQQQQEEKRGGVIQEIIMQYQMIQDFNRGQTSQPKIYRIGPLTLRQDQQEIKISWKSIHRYKNLNQKSVAFFREGIINIQVLILQKSYHDPHPVIRNQRAQTQYVPTTSPSFAKSVIVGNQQLLDKIQKDYQLMMNKQQQHQQQSDLRRAISTHNPSSPTKGNIQSPARKQKGVKNVSNNVNSNVNNKDEKCQIF